MNAQRLRAQAERLALHVQAATGALGSGHPDPNYAPGSEALSRAARALLVATDNLTALRAMVAEAAREAGGALAHLAEELEK